MYRAAIQEGKLVLQKTLQLFFNHDPLPLQRGLINYACFSHLMAWLCNFISDYDPYVSYCRAYL